MALTPKIPTRIVSVGGFILFFVFAVMLVVVAVDPGKGGFGLRAAGIVGFPLSLAAAARAATMTVRLSDDGVLVRNLLATHRVPLESVERFTTRVTRTHNGSTLTVERSDGPPITATAFPLTNIPSIRDRRQHLIACLNDWLACTRPATP
ncbi:MAG TPA: PH domain-containing protein [Thermomicrobiales bacterium]|nr:PH domain-containing protein [Thermomicrobiales bacterium]